MIIQQIHVNNEIDLYLLNVNIEKQLLTYRINKYPKMLCKDEKFSIEDDGRVIVGPYFFNVGYLQKFINEND